jgi:hypothetical protein
LFLVERRRRCLPNPGVPLSVATSVPALSCVSLRAVSFAASKSNNASESTIQKGLRATRIQTAVRLSFRSRRASLCLGRGVKPAETSLTSTRETMDLNIDEELESLQSLATSELRERDVEV